MTKVVLGERVIVSVGGSLIVPDGIDTQFLSDFRTLILKKVAEGFSFYIITGGGKIARRYRDAAVAINSSSFADDLDWVGIAACRLNAELVRTTFADRAIPEIVRDTSIPVQSDSPLLFAGGVKPGNSSDWAAVHAARAVGAKRIVNLSNVDHVYTADPRTNPDAKPIEKISWSDFGKLIPEEWSPGLSSPFDPVAAKEAEALGLEIAMINGAKVGEFQNYLGGHPVYRAINF